MILGFYNLNEKSFLVAMFFTVPWSKEDCHSYDFFYNEINYNHRSIKMNSLTIHSLTHSLIQFESRRSILI